MTQDHSQFLTFYKTLPFSSAEELALACWVESRDRAITSCTARLYSMDENTGGRHNFYQHAALELAKLRGLQ